jgi:hypothetical protein
MTKRRWLDVACVGALAALALMTWQIFDPRVWPVMVAMSLGQVLGTVSLAAFAYVVVSDFRAQLRAGRQGVGKKPDGDGDLQSATDEAQSPPLASGPGGGL